LTDSLGIELTIGIKIFIKSRRRVDLESAHPFGQELRRVGRINEA